MKMEILRSNKRLFILLLCSPIIFAIGVNVICEIIIEKFYKKNEFPKNSPTKLIRFLLWLRIIAPLLVILFFAFLYHNWLHIVWLNGDGVK